MVGGETLGELTALESRLLVTVGLFAVMRRRSHNADWIWLLLVLPFFGLLVPEVYARRDPELFGFPFFYWYQFAWLFATSVLTAIVYRKTR